MATGTRSAAQLSTAAFLIMALFAGGGTAAAAEYPRRLAIAPFDSLTGDDIKSTVAILPRLLSTRLMALAGADVLLLPAGGASPEAAAREAGVPLLLTGTVSRLGKGYSIDVTAVDLAAGKPAGVFVAAATTEDEIIPQLGVLAGEAAEKLFGVRQAVRAYAPPPAPAAGAPSVFPPVGTSAPPVSGPAVAAPPPFPDSGPAPPWAPSSMKKVANSDKVIDELYGVAAGDIDAEGNGEVVVYGRRTIYVYKIQGTQILPYTKISRGVSQHVINVDTVDLDGDGRKDLVVTLISGGAVESAVYLRKGDVFEETAVNIPYFLTVLADWKGKRVVAGQRRGVDLPFEGKLFPLRWDGKTLVAGEPFVAKTNILPLASGGPIALTAASIGSESKFLCVDDMNRLRVLDPDGKPVYKSKDKYGIGGDWFDWGPILPVEGKQKQYGLRKAPRIATAPEGKTYILVTGTSPTLFDRATGSFGSSRLVLFQWDGGEFAERTATPLSDNFYSGADFLTAGGLARGAKVVATSVEQLGGAVSDPRSRIVLLRVE